MAFRVLYDANAIFGALQRSLLIRAGQYQTEFHLRVFMTSEILDEMVAAVMGRYPDFTIEQGESLREAMIDAIPDCLITGYEYAEDSVSIIDPDDKHVLAAAIHGSVQVIVTVDRDFHPEVTAQHGIVAQRPDDFLTDLFDLNERATRAIVTDEAALRGVPISALVDLIEERGLIRFAQHLRR